MFRRAHYLPCALVATLAILSATAPALAQFGTGAYGSLVWDPDKQCWVRYNREGFPARLVEGRVTHLVGEDGRGVLIHDNEVYELVGDAPPGGVVTIGGVPSRVDSPTQQAFRQSIEQGNVPTLGPDGQPLSPNAQQFIRDTLSEGGYGDVGGDGSGYGDVPKDYDPVGDFTKEEGGIASSVHIKDYGTFYMGNRGNLMHVTGSNFDWQARGDYTSTTVWTGIGSQTYYPLSPNQGDPGSLYNITHHIDPTTSTCTAVVFHFNGRAPYILTTDNGTGLYLDPFAAGGPGGVPPVLVQQANANGGKLAWVEPRKKQPPKKKKAAPAPPANQVPLDQLEGVVLGVDWEPDFGFGASWHRRLLNENTFDYEPVDREADKGLLIQPGIQVSFLGPPPLSDAERSEIDGVADEVTALGDEIEQRRRAAAEQRQLIAGQQQIFDIFHERTVTGVDEAREKAKQVVAGQIEAGIGVLLSNSDKIKDAFDRMPDGPAKDQLGKVFNSEKWDDFVAGGADSIASGSFDTYKFAKDLYTGGIGEAALNFLPDKAQLAIGQIRAAHKLSQAAGGLLEGTWNVSELEDMGDALETSQRQYHIHMQGTRDLILQQQELAGRVVELTENAVRGVDGLDRVRFINGVIQELENNSGGIDVTDQLNELRTLRDDTIIYLPGGEWGTEPVLYHRLGVVKNAAARMRMLFNQNMAAKYGPDWDAPIRPQQPGLVMLPPISQGSGTKVQPGETGGTPKPKAEEENQSFKPVPLDLPEGAPQISTGPDFGPITLGGVGGPTIYDYGTGKIARAIRMPDGNLITHYRNGDVEVTTPDGTRTVKTPGGLTRVTLPDGTVVTKNPNGGTITESDDGRVLLLGGGGGSDDVLGHLNEGGDILVLPGSSAPIGSDYDSDGDVDAQDYQLFKRTFDLEIDSNLSSFGSSPGN